jgi:EAL domain-containing protein (putative c-di-GMP-specific phosphodiesterase class I)
LTTLGRAGFTQWRAPVATRCGLIADLSNAVMAAAIDEATLWPDDLALSINLSRSELRNPGLAGRIIALTEGAGLPAERLEVEVCESSLLHDSEVPLATIFRLRSSGIGLSLEDFGTGYTALARFRELPFDRIKIDRTFAQSLNSDCHSGSIVAAITSPGKSLSLPIAAEEIEEVRAQERLLYLGATGGQVLLYGDAIFGEQTGQLLRALNGFAALRRDTAPCLEPHTRAA